MNSVRQDIVFALRSVRRRPGFATVAIATLALGIGAATTIYSVVDGVLFRPLPFREPARLTAIWQTYPRWLKDPMLSKSWDRNHLSIPEYRDLRAATTAFTDVAIWTGRRVMLGRFDSQEQVRIANASASLLAVLGAAPTVGRYFRPEEDTVGGVPVAMVSYDAWQARYQGDPAVVGRAVWLDDSSYTIVGVLPREISLSREDGLNAEPLFWTPVGRNAWDATHRDNHSYIALGRLNPGVSLAQAREETARILRGEETSETKGVRLDGSQTDQTRNVRASLLILLGAVGVVLLIACVNTAILLLGEASNREPEIAVRIALGAGRSRIVAQLLTESVALAGVGAALGTGIAWGGTRLMVALAPPGIPGLAAVGIDARVLVFTVIAATGTGILFGLAPALALSRSTPGQVFRAASGQNARGRGSLHRALVAAELALSLMLLVGAALLSRSLSKLSAVDPGFRADHLLTIRVALPRALARDSVATREFYRATVERLHAVPGVMRVSAGQPPFGEATGGSTDVQIESEPNEPIRDCSSMAAVLARRCATVRTPSVLPGYLETLGVPLIAGRTLGDTDAPGAPLVLVISEAMAKRDFPVASALGKRVRVHGAWREVVGIVGDTKVDRVSAESRPTAYLPLSQRSNTSLQFLIRSGVEPLSLVPAIREALHQVAPNATVLSVDRMIDVIRGTFAEERYRTMLISLFGIIAGTLAAVGMYGVTSRAVRGRTREMGIRLALGATPANVTGLLVRYTLAGVAIGVGAGVVGALLGSRALTPFLFGVTGTDGLAYATSIVLLAAISVVASWLPVRRAARLQPADVLRGE